MPFSRPISVGEAIGTALITSTPPATTRSWVPDSTAWAAKCNACWEDPHWRSMVVPGTRSGSPAESTVIRPMFDAWGPTCPTQPHSTSSIASGETPVRSTRARSTAAPRSAGCTPARVPPRLPTADRTAPTM